MKLTKILGLAAVAAVAAMAFAGSASAVRLHPLIKFCNIQELLLCPDSSVLEMKGDLKGLQEGIGTLEGTINQKCTGGEIVGTIPPSSVEGPGAEESRLLGKTTALKFTGCEPCKKITGVGLPFNTNLVHSTETGAWTLESEGFAKFEECSFGVTCKFGSKKLTPAPIVEMSATHSWVNTNKAVLNREEGSEFFCGNTGKWNAKYLLELDLLNGTIHKPIWPTLCKKEAPVNSCR